MVRFVKRTDGKVVDMEVAEADGRELPIRADRVVGVDPSGSIINESFSVANDTSSQILNELKILNSHMQLITGEKLKEEI